MTIIGLSIFCQGLRSPSLAPPEVCIMRNILKSIGPAIVVAAVVLGPGSILTSSKVGASLGLLGLPVVLVATLLMIGMVGLSATLGAVYEDSVCEELAKRLGRGTSVTIGLILFGVVALFQSSNNLALIGGLEPILPDGSVDFQLQCIVLCGFNGVMIAFLYLLRDLAKAVESLMKLLIGLVTLALILNAFAVFTTDTGIQKIEPDHAIDWLSLLGMVGTTLSIGGAFYQSYLVRERGWKLQDLPRALKDSIVSISVLGIVTGLLLLTAWKVFYGLPVPVKLESVGDVARQLEPLFGRSATAIFCIGILAGAVSSFLVNALIGGTVLSDSCGLGSKVSDRWPLHFTTLALLIGMVVAIGRLSSKEGTVHLITFAQALTVIGGPALAATLLYLGTRPELTGDRRVAKPILMVAWVGFLVSCALALKTAATVYEKIG